MKYLLLMTLLFSCALGKKSELPLFDRTKDCSDMALHYLKSKNSKESSSKISKKAIKDVNQLMQSLAPDIKNCYQNEIDSRSNKAYNLCLVTGYNNQGEQEYLSFSILKEEVSGPFGACLKKLKNHKGFQKIKVKNVTIVQPYRLIPTTY